jgi:hypothetical protein
VPTHASLQTSLHSKQPLPSLRQWSISLVDQLLCPLLFATRSQSFFQLNAFIELAGIRSAARLGAAASNPAVSIDFFNSSGNNLWLSSTLRIQFVIKFYTSVWNLSVDRSPARIARWRLPLSASWPSIDASSTVCDASSVSSRLRRLRAWCVARPSVLALVLSPTCPIKGGRSAGTPCCRSLQSTRGLAARCVPSWTRKTGLSELLPSASATPTFLRTEVARDVTALRWGGLLRSHRRVVTFEFTCCMGRLMPAIDAS